MGEKKSNNQVIAGNKESKELLVESSQKRKTLKKVGAGSALILGASALPKTWNAPSIESVITPAHAQMSPMATTEQVTTTEEVNTTATPTTTAQVTTTTPVTTTISTTSSDVRLKTDIEQVGSIYNGVNLYKFRYTEDSEQQFYVGLMAQELIAEYPESLVRDKFGFYSVNYQHFGLKMATHEEWEISGEQSVTLLQ